MRKRDKSKDKTSRGTPQLPRDALNRIDLGQWSCPDLMDSCSRYAAINSYSSGVT